MATEKALKKVRWFILYGSERPLCRAESIMNKIRRVLLKSDCPALVNLIEVGNGMQVINQVKSVVHASATTNPTRCGYYKAAAIFALVLLTKSPQTTPLIKTEAYRLFHDVCLTSEELFLFHHFLVEKQNVDRERANVAERAAATIARADASTDSSATSPAVPPAVRSGQNNKPVPDPPENDDHEAPPAKRKRANCSNGLKRAMNRWYNSKDPMALAKDATGCVNRFGQTHAMIIKTFHPKPESKALEIVFNQLGVRGMESPRKNHSSKQRKANLERISAAVDLDEKATRVLQYYQGLEKLYGLTSGKEKLKKEERKTMLNGPIAADASAILTEAQIPLFTGVPFELWGSAVVSEALIPHMTVRQILYRLPYLSHLGLIPAQPESPDPCLTLVDRSKITQEKIHPFEVIAGMRRYEAGKFKEVKGFKLPNSEDQVSKRPQSIKSWNVSDKVISAVDRAFDLALELMPPIVGRRVLIALDVQKRNRNDTVTGGVVGLDSERTIAIMTSILNYQCGGREGRTAEEVKVEGEATATTPAEGGFCHVVAFSRKSVPTEADVKFEDEPAFPTIELSPTQGYCDILKAMDSTLCGDVDVASLIQHCQENELRYDAIIVFAGKYSTPLNPPKAALKRYREAMNLPTSKLIVVGTASTMFSVADVEDDNMLDVVGFGVLCAERVHDFLLS